MPKMTETEIAEVQGLWEKFALLSSERESLKWEISKIEAELYENRCAMEDTLRKIEDIQGELDWG